MFRQPALAALVVLAVPFVGADSHPPVPTSSAQERPPRGELRPTDHVGLGEVNEADSSSPERRGPAASTTGSTVTRADGETDTAEPGQRVLAAESAADISLRPDDAEHRARVDEAVRRFEEAGLHLPAVLVEFSDDGCFGHHGVFDRSSQPWTVHVCSDLEFVLTHELGHAWVAAHLDDEDRTAYVEFRGLPAWNDPDLHWRERGTEDAAFVLQRVLMTKHVRPDWPVWRELRAAYEQLTGQLPPQVAEA